MKICKYFLTLSILVLSAQAGEIENSLTLLGGIPQFIDLQYDLTISKTCISIRPGLGLFAAYKYVGNKYKSDLWFMNPEIGISYWFINNANLKFGPSLSLTYVFQNRYGFPNRSGNYFEELKEEELLGNIKGIALMKIYGINLLGSIGLIISKDVIKKHIVENGISSYTTEYNNSINSLLFPSVALGISYKFQTDKQGK
jgi:hypothetical protein